jgi:hypothetical protein
VAGGLADVFTSGTAFEERTQQAVGADLGLINADTLAEHARRLFLNPRRRDRSEKAVRSSPC